MVKTAAEIVGGGGGGRDTLAQAGGRDPEKLKEAIDGGARGDRVGARRLMRVLALDYGSARCGCALSDPTGTIVTPIAAVPRPGSRRGLQTLKELVREREVERVVVGLPLSLRGRRHRPDARDAGVRPAAVASPRRGDAGGDARRALHHAHRPAHGGPVHRERGLARRGPPAGELADGPIALGEVRSRLLNLYSPALVSRQPITATARTHRGGTRARPRRARATSRRPISARTDGRAPQRAPPRQPLRAGRPRVPPRPGRGRSRSSAGLADPRPRTGPRRRPRGFDEGRPGVLAESLRDPPVWPPAAVTVPASRAALGGEPVETRLAPPGWVGRAGRGPHSAGEPVEAALVAPVLGRIRWPAPIRPGRPSRSRRRASRGWVAWAGGPTRRGARRDPPVGAPPMVGSGSLGRVPIPAGEPVEVSPCAPPAVGLAIGCRPRAISAGSLSRSRPRCVGEESAPLEPAVPLESPAASTLGADGPRGRRGDVGVSFDGGAYGRCPRARVRCWRLGRRSRRWDCYSTPSAPGTSGQPRAQPS